jgi:hypothetical protein
LLPALKPPSPSKLVPLRPPDAPTAAAAGADGPPELTRPPTPAKVDGCGVFFRFSLAGLARPAQSVFVVGTSTATLASAFTAALWPTLRAANDGFFLLAAAAVALLRVLASCPAPRLATMRRPSSEEADEARELPAMGDRFPTGPSCDSRARNEWITS